MIRLSRHFSSLAKLRSKITASVVPPHHAHRPQQSPPKTFASLKLHPALVSAVTSYFQPSTPSPTPIQIRAAPPLTNGQHTLIAAETGAGKTLAYMLPLFSRLKATEVPPVESFGVQQLPNRPRVLIVVPTRELAMQTLQTAKQIARVAKIRVRGAFSGTAKRDHGIVDVVIGTPGGVEKARNQGKMFMSRVESVVVDEADAIMCAEGGFLEQIAGGLGGVDGQFVYVSASVPQWLREGLKERHGKVVEARGDALHRISDAVEVVFVKVGGWQRKMEKIEDIVREVRSGVMIFCSRKKRREELAERLREEGANVVELWGDAKERDGAWERFKEEGGVAICGGSGGRGLDCEGVRCVVLCDGGTEMHRVGRIRGEGVAYVLVGREGTMKRGLEWMKEKAKRVRLVEEE